MFVHDFVHVDRPLAEIIGRFGPLADPWLGSLVVAAWADIREDWEAAGIEPAELDVPSGLRVTLGIPRFRDDSVIVPIGWPAGDRRFVPGLEADLELASFGPDRTHIQLLGRYRFAPGVDRWTREGSLAHRITVAGVRRFLELLARELEQGLVPAPGRAAAPPTSVRLVAGMVVARQVSHAAVVAPRLDAPTDDVAPGPDDAAGRTDPSIT